GRDAVAPGGPPSVPRIELPKGGGAIRGIDQKFAANPATGTGSLSISIPASPGRSGFGPQPAVTYDSGHGNGTFGGAFALAMQAIIRRTDKAIPRYDDAAPPERTDIFVISSAEDLVPVLREGTREPNEFDRDGHRVKRYRPRIEGLFARIERWTSHADGTTH